MGINRSDNLPARRHQPWQPGVDVLSKYKHFRSVEDLIHVIQPYRITTKKKAYSVLQPTSRSVKIVDKAIEKMMGG